ncbi:MAG: nucleotidyltransferase family protein [Bdellovibrionales bacterium]|nr:nucleotidyltransferase family protein [Bdellovibrionales bacterium]
MPPSGSVCQFLLQALNQDPITHLLSTEEEAQLQHLVNEHKIEGYILPYRHQLKSPRLIAHLEAVVKKNTLQNLILKQNWMEIQKECEKINITPSGFKGIDLIQWLVSPGSRPLTDIDVYVEPQYFSDVSKVLQRLNYQAVDESKWFANAHKSTFKSIEGLIETTVEVHTQLFYNQAVSTQWRFENRSHGSSLVPADQVIYLSYHLAHQHTFLKLFWLMDLVRLTQSHPNVWNEELFLRAKSLGAFQAVMSVAYVLNCFFKSGIHLPPAKIKARPCLTWEFLVSPEAYRWRYYTAKHLLKDSFAESLTYDLGWVKHRWSGLLSPKSIDRT